MGQEHIFDNILSVWPLPADPGHESDLKNQENHQKIAKNAIFQKSIFCYKVAGDGSFGPRKAPRKPILNILHNLAIFSKKQKKIAFLTIKIDVKKFSRPNFPADV